MDCSTPGFPVLYYLQEFAQTHVHWVGDAIPTISSSHPLLLLPSIFPSIRVFPMSWLFTSGGQSIETSASASFLPIQGENKHAEVKMNLYMYICICIIYNPILHLKYGISLVHESAWLFWVAPLLPASPWRPEGWRYLKTHLLTCVHLGCEGPRWGWTRWGSLSIFLCVAFAHGLSSLVAASGEPMKMWFCFLKKKKKKLVYTFGCMSWILVAAWAFL